MVCYTTSQSRVNKGNASLFSATNSSTTQHTVWRKGKMQTTPSVHLTCLTERIPVSNFSACLRSHRLLPAYDTSLCNANQVCCAPAHQMIVHAAFHTRMVHMCCLPPSRLDTACGTCALVPAHCRPLARGAPVRLTDAVDKVLHLIPTITVIPVVGKQQCRRHKAALISASY